MRKKLAVIFSLIHYSMACVTFYSRLGECLITWCQPTAVMWVSWPLARPVYRCSPSGQQNICVYMRPGNMCHWYYHWDIKLPVIIIIQALITNTIRICVHMFVFVYMFTWPAGDLWPVSGSYLTTLLPLMWPLPWTHQAGLGGILYSCKLVPQKLCPRWHKDCREPHIIPGPSLIAN